MKTGRDGEVTRVRDVARVELGARDYSTKTYMDGFSRRFVRVFQLPGSNSLKTADEIYRRARRDEEKLPARRGLLRINYDPTQFIRASRSNPCCTRLIEAILLVVIVVVVFLQTWRASIIPLIAVPVSLIGTLAVMQFGFSLNNLSLFGIVLAIGIVVDDAIVVVENVERFIAQGLSPREATIGRWRSDRPGHRGGARALRGIRADGVHQRHLGPNSTSSSR